MATVTGLSKDRMLAIEAASVVDGEVDGSGHLILERFDGTPIDAGSVIGPQGPQGVVGPAIPFVGVQNLNTYSSGGFWAETSDVNAAAGTNYPEPYAGLLEVYNNGVTHIYQRYTIYATQGSRVWIRGYAGGVWSAWVLQATQFQKEQTVHALSYTASYRATTNVNRKPLALIRDVFGKFWLEGCFEHTSTMVGWTSYQQIIIGAVPAGTIPLKDIVAVGDVNVPGTLAKASRLIVRGQNTTSDFVGTPGQIVWQSFSGDTFGATQPYFFIYGVSWFV